MMDDKGFPKLLRVDEIDISNHPCTQSPMHDFMHMGALQKDDKQEENGVVTRQEVVMLQVYVCRRCLLHVHLEMLRVEQNQPNLFDQLDAQQQPKM